VRVIMRERQVSVEALSDFRNDNVDTDGSMCRRSSKRAQRMRTESVCEAIAEVMASLGLKRWIPGRDANPVPTPRLVVAVELRS
jgi:hypothetical protein